MRNPNTPDGHLEFFFATFKTLQKLRGRLGASEAERNQKESLDVVGRALGRTPLLFVPHILWLSAMYQGVVSWIQDVSDILGKNIVKPPDPQCSIDDLQDQFLAALDLLENNQEYINTVKVSLHEGVAAVTGAPLGGCFVGFSAPVGLPLERVKLEATSENPFTSAYLITNNQILAFRTMIGEENDDGSIYVKYLYGPEGWTNALSGEGHIFLSLIQMLNLSYTQMVKKQSFGFKRMAQRVAKSYRIECIKTPPFYELPANVAPPEHAYRAPLKLPGMKSKETTTTHVVASTTTVAERFITLRSKISLNNLHGEKIDQFGPAFLRGLREARIFEIPAELYFGFYRQADKYTTEQIAGFEWEPPPDESEMWSEDHMTAVEFVQCVNEAGTHLELPEKRPFDVFYFGYNPPPVIQEAMYSVYSLDEYDRQTMISYAEIIGHLVVDNLVFTCFALRFANGRQAYSYLVEHSKDEWFMPYTLAPWILSGLIDWVNEHQTVVQDDTKSHKYVRETRKLLKQFHLKRDAPPPYYTVYMRDLVINKSVKRTFTSRFKKIIDWSHRWEVRGHYMVRIKRGPIPLDEKLAKVLRKRKYEIYTEENPPFDVWQKLEARGIPPKRANEWLAVLVSFRHDFVKGPEDKPLVPSVRKSARYANEGDERSLFDDQDIDETVGD